MATVGADGRPSTRIVLVKSFDASGVVFYTNYHSRKARELEAHPQAALQFHWVDLERVRGFPPLAMDPFSFRRTLPLPARTGRGRR